MVRPRLAVLIPAHHEENTIGSVVAEAGKYGEVVVVDDASSDGTSDRAREAGAKVFRNEANLGYEGTLNRLFELADELGFTHAVTIDADGEHAPHLLERFRHELIERDVPLVLGYRPRKQRFSEVVMGYFIKAKYGVEDILCGMKGYDLALWRRHGGFDGNGLIGTELAISAIAAGIPFTQIAVNGTRRTDQPRFDGRLRANLRIFAALRRIIAAPPSL